MQLSDIAVVEHIAELTWGSDYYERPEVFAQRLEWWPAGCWVYNDSGYIISHPAQVGYPPGLNEPVNYRSTNCYHIHDINLLPELRGQGIANQILTRFWDWPCITLVAANNTESFWEHYGFRRHSIVDYGSYMIK
jgi:GNAT superfamily N-acetyltransferase